MANNDTNETLTEDEARLSEILTTPMQVKFCIAYVENGGHGTRAAITAGYAEKNAAQAASRLLKEDKIQKGVRTYAKAVAKVAGENKETILARTINRAQLDVRDYFIIVPLIGEDGRPVIGAGGMPLATEEMKRLSDLTTEEAQRVKKLSWNQAGPVIEFHDPAIADRDLANLLGYTKNDDARLGAEDAAALIAAAMEAMDEADGIPSSAPE